jgi:hypothetical protein
MSATMLTDVQADVFPDKAELDAAEERLSEAVTPFEILSMAFRRGQEEDVPMPTLTVEQAWHVVNTVRYTRMMAETLLKDLAEIESGAFWAFQEGQEEAA